ncbi:MAG: MerR family transcriptional regulator [Bacillota bacterium]|nr:MerR family transcriptional regulator [Bacillota bacterium]MDW7678411.1 MerR family transcriptional regulator [Bacillota bacterium]
MKIGEFAKRFQIPISKVRYYVHVGLLLPAKTGSQYSFSDADLADMKLIQELKDLSFSIEEIKKYLHVMRVYSPSDNRVHTVLDSLMTRKIVDLEQEISDIHARIDQLKHKLNRPDMVDSTHQTRDTYGIPLDFIPLLRCPQCGNPFALEKAMIRNNTVIDGEFTCSCHASLRIEDGILLSSLNSEADYYSSHDFYMLHYQEIPDEDQDFVYFQYMNNISSESTSLIVKSYAWLDSHIRKLNAHSEKKVVFVPDLSSHFLYKYGNQPYFRDALIIVSGFSKNNVSAIKSHIEEVAPGLHVLYIANTIFDLPLKKMCIDMWIDAFSSYNFAFFHEYSLYKKISSYIKPEADVFGCVKHYLPKTISRKNIDKAYTRHMSNHYSLFHFKQMMTDEGYEMVADEDLGYTTNPGAYYEYHVAGEKQMFHAFHAIKSHPGHG